MSKLEAIVSKFPGQESAIRDLCRRDVGFMCTCNDYEVASIALRHWEGLGSEFAKRADEYHQILDELEAEIRERLDTKRLRGAPDGD